MSWFRVIIMIELLIIVTLSVWMCRPKDDPRFEELEAYNLALQQEIDSLLMANKSLDQEIKNLNSQADSLKILADQKQQQVAKLKTTRDEKINAIDNFNHDELVGFFTKLEFNPEGTGN